jgi:AcrR family transcriptional regulator
MKPGSIRAVGKAATREKALSAARAVFSRGDYEHATIRDIAAEAGLSTGAIFANWSGKAELWRAAFGFPYPWRPIKDAPTDATLCLLLVDYAEATNAAAVTAHDEAGLLWPHTPLEDARFARTIGHNNDSNVSSGEGEGWQFAGWCWSQDCYREGHGTPVAFIRLDLIAAVPPGLEPSE